MFPASLVLTISLCFLSGVLSGLVYRHHRGSSAWLPGVLFGLFFGFSQFQATEVIISFAAISGIIYALAVLGSTILFSLAWNIKNKVGGFLMMGFFYLLPGGFGALCLVLILMVFKDIGFNLGYDGITTLAGVFFGAILLRFIAFEEVSWVMAPILSVFSHKSNDTEKPDKSLTLYIGELIKFTIVFTLWQVSVGIMLTIGVESKPIIHSSRFVDSLNTFLLGPTVQLFGLIASIFGILSFLNVQKRK